MCEARRILCLMIVSHILKLEFCLDVVRNAKEDVPWDCGANWYFPVNIKHES
jgi:hypothetical protein